MAIKREVQVQHAQNLLTKPDSENLARKDILMENNILIQVLKDAYTIAPGRFTDAWTDVHITSSGLEYLGFLMGPEFLYARDGETSV